MAANFSKVSTLEDISWIAEVAPTLFHEVYDPYIPKHHTDHFIEKHQSREAIQHQLENLGFRYWIIKQDEEKAGYLGLEPKGKTLVLSKVYLLPTYRSRGLGSKAMRFTEEFARTNGFEKIELIANQNNKEAIEVYQHFGYSIAEGYTTKHDTGVAICDYRMEKKLRD